MLTSFLYNMFWYAFVLSH
uniref:Uncharacterized protein n=1 Tax=Arundo donax TaxID=35708 RepID=A0A0A9AY43_ARUDO